MLALPMEDIQYIIQAPGGYIPGSQATTTTRAATQTDGPHTLRK